MPWANMWLDERSSRKSREAMKFQQIVFDVFMDPDQERPLARGRHAYWSDRHSTVVIVDSESESGGTAFRPKNGRNYFLFGLH